MLKLIVGLGNPGPTYQKTRHNAGAWWLNELAQHYRIQFHLEKKFELELAELKLQHSHCILAKTISYMNVSGAAIARYARFFQINPAEILIAHDDLDLLPGQVRFKVGGGHGGHNGLRDLIQHLGANDFCRLRIGIGHPGNKDKVAGFVLQVPRLEEKLEIEHGLMRVLPLVPDMIQANVNRVMLQLHTAP